LPMPNSHYLMPASSFESVSPCIYKAGVDLKNAQKTIQKNNKRLKGTDQSLVALRKTFECVRGYHADKRGVWCAIDFESWEMEHAMLTEFGWSMLTWQDGKERIVDGHTAVAERSSYRNGKYIIDNRDHFLFGKTQHLDFKEWKKHIHSLILKSSKPGPLFLIFHDKSQDLKYLKAIEAPIAALSATLPDATPDHGIFAIDTAEIFAALEGDSRERRGLERMCLLLGIKDVERLHNAGNDAHSHGSWSTC